MTTHATLKCPNGCFEINYRATLPDGDSDDERDLINELGTPGKLPETGNRCPNCKSEVTVDRDWGDDADD